MGVRSALASRLTRMAARLGDPVAKSFGSSVPPAIEAAEARAQMTPASPFSPGEPIGPYDGYSRTPRAHDFVTGYNIATRPRTHERVSFETLKGLIDSYDVAKIVIRHRIASIRSLDWKLVAAQGYDGDVSRDIPYGMEALRRPDRKTLFKPWLAKYLRDVLSYDAGSLYRMRNRGGRAVGLKVVSGIQIAPLLDYWGDSPESPAPAYVQYANGLPWNWLSRDDLIYEPYDPQPDSIYGLAPLEDILLNANTDIRFQLYFLQRFTEGNLPHAFASAPESWTPDQIEQFQEYWDAFMMGDQSRKHQIRWVPGGSSFAWTDEKEFTDHFSLFLMRKTCAAYSVVPSDLGFTESVNRSSGESQADVQHRVGDLPLAHHIQDILSSFLQDDLQMPLRFAFDLGEEQDDRRDQAEADKVYTELGVVGPSELREMRYGLTDPVPIPRYIFTERAGPIPVASLMAVAGEIDPATALPAIGAPLPREVFGGTEGVLPNPPIKVMSLAEREYGPKAMPPAPPPQPVLTPDDTGGLVVAKEGDAAPGITSETGIYGYDLGGDDDEEDAAEVAKELAAFRRYSRARRRAGEWRDFRFGHVPALEAAALNAEGRASVAKAAGDDGKVSKASVNYRKADDLGPRCSTCSMIRRAPGGGDMCTLVEGLIDPSAVCDRWDPGQGAAVAKAATRPKAAAWPGWKLDLHAAAHWAPKVTAEARKSLTRSKLAGIATAYIRDHPQQDGKATGKRERTDAAIAWLTARGVTVPMGPVASGIAADGYMIGAASADAATQGQDTADTGGWEPGDTSTATTVVAGLGLAAGLGSLLDGGGSGDGGAAADIAGDMGDGYLTVTARVLAGWDPDVAADELTGMLEDAVADGGYAEALTVTQITVASGQAALALYLARSQSLVSWQITDDARVCPRCLTNEQAGPVRAGTAFPSGDKAPPAHHGCRCALIPEWL